jgi:ABC-2 type transport system permease protein
MAVDASAPRAAAVINPIPRRRRLYGFGSIYGKTLRDSRLGVVVVGGLLGFMILAGGGEMTSTYETLDARRELDVLSATLPPVMRGLYGNPVNVGTIGGFVTWHYGAYLALLAGLWSILALSSTLAGEARRASLDLVAAAPISRARIALEKVAGHVTALAIAAAIIAVAAWATGAVFAVFPGDEIPPTAAVSFGAGIAVKALMAGSVAFALAALVGRSAAAGIAGALLFGGYVVTGYRAVVPAFDAVAGLSWLGWTADHLPLAGRSDWGSLGLVAVASAVLLGIGVAAFVRRDIGITGTSRVPSLPPMLLGIGGPVRRAFGEVLPASVAWGVGLGLYGLLMAAASRAFVDELAKAPSLLEMIDNLLPGMDWSTPVGFLQVLFVDFGLVLVGLAAATLVAGGMGDELDGRFELLLATPLSRAHWAVANGVGAVLGIAVVTAFVAGSLAIGVTAAGGEVGTPLVGTLVLALYGAALVGVGFAVGGLVGPSIAGWTVAGLAIGTFLVDILGPALALPDWLQQLALSNHVGAPMLGTWDLGGIATCLVLAVGGLALGAWGLRRRDVGD